MAVPGAGQQHFDEAKEFLLDALADHNPHPAADLYREAGKLGISDRTLKRALAAIGAKSEKKGLLEATAWSLPHWNLRENYIAETLQDLQDSLVRMQETLAQLELAFITLVHATTRSHPKP